VHILCKTSRINTPKLSGSLEFLKCKVMLLKTAACCCYIRVKIDLAIGRILFDAIGSCIKLRTIQYNEIFVYLLCTTNVTYCKTQQKIKLFSEQEASDAQPTIIVCSFYIDPSRKISPGLP